ncbi:MAG: DUF4070 domain-containing protein, partial [Chloroflexi bacterium]
AYYARVQDLLRRLGRAQHHRQVGWAEVRTLVRALWMLGVRSPRRGLFWRLLLGTLVRRPRLFAEAGGQGVVGEHMIRYTQEEVLPRLAASLDELQSERRDQSSSPSRTSRYPGSERPGVPASQTRATSPWASASRIGSSFSRLL